MNRIVEPGNPLASGTGNNETHTRLSVQPAILAGGASSRLWPLSRARNPKQLTDLMGDESLLEATLSRLDAAFATAARSAKAPALVAMSMPLVVCSKDLRMQTPGGLEQGGRRASMVLEPASRNTAPALTVAALAARASAVEGDDPIMVALPSDHLIVDHGAFGAALAEALVHAAHGAIVTLGVPPHRAATGYGYIRTGMARGTQGARAIERFVETPDAELAERYVASGEYWWNSGMFVVRASVWLAAIQVCRPVIAAACGQAFEHATKDSDGTVHLAHDPFAACPSDSIDYAMMERIGTDARLAGVVIPLVAGWSNDGAWDSVWDASTRDADGHVVRRRSRQLSVA